MVAPPAAEAQISAATATFCTDQTSHFLAMVTATKAYGYILTQIVIIRQ